MLVADRPMWPRFRSAIMMTAALALAPQVARAQVFGTWSQAVPYPVDSYNAGAFLLVGEPLGLVGQFRTGVDDRWDIGIQSGFPDFDAGGGGDAIFGIAGDAKYLIAPEGEDFPVDLAVDVAFGLQHVSDVNRVDFDFGGIASESITTEGGKTFIPYGALILAVGHVESDTELDIHVRFGLDYPINSEVEFLSELNLSSREDTIALALGLMAKL